MTDWVLNDYIYYGRRPIVYPIVVDVKPKPRLIAKLILHLEKTKETYKLYDGEGCQAVSVETNRTVTYGLTSAGYLWVTLTYLTPQAEEIKSLEPLPEDTPDVLRMKLQKALHPAEGKIQSTSLLLEDGKPMQLNVAGFPNYVFTYEKM
jgi:hypothetical protein